MCVQVLIVEGNPFVRVGLETILDDEEGIEICGVYDSSSDALAACSTLQPDVVLIDRPLARELPLPAVRECCSGQGGVLVFLDRLHEEEIFEMLSAGVAGFIAKRDDPETLCQAIRAVADGDEIWLSPRVSKMLLPPRRRPSIQTRLSRREQEILRAMAQGEPNSAIAEVHCLSVGTLRNIVSAIYAKLGVKRRAEALAWAWRNGIVDIAHPEDAPEQSDGGGPSQSDALRS